jgi:hypothetical protein
MRIKHNVQGVTLVSLLVGITLGTFLIIVMLQIFSSTRANFKLSQNLSEMNNVLRYASLKMTNVISQAGYRTPDPTTGVLPTYSTAFQAFTNTLTGPSATTYDDTQTNASNPAGVVLSYFPGEDIILSSGGVDTGDKLWVKFEGDPTGQIQDCNDLYGAAGTDIMVMFYSQQITVSSVNSTAYYCQRVDDGTNYTYSNTPIGVELIPAALFDSAWVRYGEDISAKGYIDRWSLGTDVRDRNRVYAIRVAFLIHSRDDVRSDSVTQTFYVFGQTITRTSKKIYKLYTFTVMLPNAPNYALGSVVTTP